MPLKTCSSCQAQVGPRTITCKCGYEFAAKAATPAEPVPVETQDEVEDAGIFAAAGPCPLPPTGSDEDAILDWACDVRQKCRERGQNILLGALLLWAARFWPIETGEWLRVRNILVREGEALENA